MTDASAIHAATPVLSVFEPRGLPARTVLYHRRAKGQPVERRVNRQAYDTPGRLVAQWDARLWALVEGGSTAPANQTSIHSLSGKALAQTSVDAGWRLSLSGEADQVTHQWDSRGTHTRIEYDPLLRPVTVFEQVQGEPERCAERLAYGGPEAGPNNLCGQLKRHDDPAGSLQVHEAGLNGGVLQQSRRFLLEHTPPDWPQELPLRDALLESAPERAMTQHHYDALGNVLTQTDAKGHRQRFIYSMVGHLHSVWLQLAGQAEQTLLSTIGYNASAQVETQTAGNGLVTTADYCSMDGRLMRLLTRRADGTCLQDLRYDYDPVGNILSIRDDAQPVRFFNNQRIEPVSTYRYDTLYQLIEATGREIATGRQGPALPELQPTPLDANRLSQFVQTYDYDAGNNLTMLRHVGAQSYTHEMQVAPFSNRSVPKDVDLAAAFDANGNLSQLQPGQMLGWDLRNQLERVTPVERLDAANDDEVYVYDGAGRRVRKIRRTQARKVSHQAEVRYLPGLELRTDTANGESLQVINVSVGLGGVRVLHWEAGLPSGMNNDQLRYSVSDHLGSGSLELDQQARLLSQEGYYPYGGTAWWAGRNAIEAKYKTLRYSGKERDATGLYCYGFRYYAPWLGRWINPDPAGDIDGLNRFRMVRNNPVTLCDQDGREPIYPVLGAFLSDVFHDAEYDLVGSQRLEPGASAGHAPIAIWGDRIHVGTAQRHMGIRPTDETGFPDFVGEITGQEITNDSGHYRPPGGLGHLVPEGYAYKEKHPAGASTQIRLTMLTSPQDYVDKVTVFRKEHDRSKRAEAVLGFLADNGMQGEAQRAALAYENVHITRLFRDAGLDVEKSFGEVLLELEGQVAPLETVIALNPRSSQSNKAKLAMLENRIAAMTDISAKAPEVLRQPYSAYKGGAGLLRSSPAAAVFANPAKPPVARPVKKSGFLHRMKNAIGR